MTIHRLLSALAVVLLLGGCAPKIETKPVDKDLGAAPMPYFPVGSTWALLRNGEDLRLTLAARNGDQVTMEDTRDRSWTRSENFFAPAVRYSNFNGTSGTQKITGGEGKIWPLKLGKTQSWSLTGSNDKGDTWSTIRRCAVKSTEQVKVPAGTFDTYKVVCEDTWRRRTWYYAPEIKSTALFTNYHKVKGHKNILELVAAPAAP